MNLIATIAKIPAPDPTKPLNPFMPIFYCQLMKEDYLMYGYPENYELLIFSPEDKVIKKIIKDYNPVPISESDKDKKIPTIQILIFAGGGLI